MPTAVRPAVNMSARTATAVPVAVPAKKTKKQKRRAALLKIGKGIAKIGKKALDAYTSGAIGRARAGDSSGLAGIFGGGAAGSSTAPATPTNGPAFEASTGLPAWALPVGGIVALGVVAWALSGSGRAA